MAGRDPMTSPSTRKTKVDVLIIVVIQDGLKCRRREGGGFASPYNESYPFYPGKLDPGWA
jgi:hypothetical protein